MKLDTSSYYPDPLLPPEDDADEKNITGDSEASSSLQEAAEIANASLIDVESNSGKESEESGSGSKDGREGGFLNSLSTLLSWGLVPLLMPVYGMMMMFDLTVLSYAGADSKWIITTMVFIFNCAIPILLILLLKKMGLVEDYGLNGRKERLFPYIITMFAMGGTAVYVTLNGAPMWTAMFFAGGGLAALVNLIVNFRWKISAHAAGIAGIVALLVHLGHMNFRPDNSLLVWLIVWIVLAGLLGSARIWLGRHTLMQVLAGTAVGFCCVYFPITFL